MKFINVIFNEHHPDPDRFDKLCKELDRQGILDNADMYPCIRLSESVEASINASHKMLVRMAKEAGLPEVCILEDDVWFPAKDGFTWWLAQKPAAYEPWDIYLGGTYGGRDGNTVTYPIGLHAYVIRSRFYDKFLAIDPTKHIDTALEGLGIFKICYPFAAIQRPGYSANNRKDVNYNVSLRKEDVYYGPEDPDFYLTPEFD